MGDVVYYLRRNGLIKIGWSGNLKARMRALRPDELLAVEPGCMHQETARHHQFAEHRLPNTGDGDEWFQPVLELLNHIELIARMYPTPSLAELMQRTGTRRGPASPELYEQADVLMNARHLLAEVLTEINRQGDNFATIGGRLGVHEHTASRWARPPQLDFRRRRTARRLALASSEGDPPR